MAFTELHATNLPEARVEKSPLFILLFSGSGLHLNNSTLKSVWVSAIQHTTTTLSLKFEPAPSSYAEVVIMSLSMLKYKYLPQEEKKDSVKKVKDKRINQKAKKMNQISVNLYSR